MLDADWLVLVLNCENAGGELRNLTTLILLLGGHLLLPHCTQSTPLRIMFNLAIFKLINFVLQFITLTF